jgi:3-hydroxybutyryl-CoA dehydrogenase
MNIVIVGELPLLEKLTAIIVDSEHNVDAYLVEDFLAAEESGIIMDNISSADVAIEVQNESPQAKKKLLGSLANVVSSEAMVLTSALTTSATQAAAWINSPERVTGFGLVPPLKSGNTVEVSYPLQASEKKSKSALDFWRSINLQPVIVADSAGLVRPRIVCCLINEAITALMEGVATVENIDLAMKMGTNYPFGPLEWADVIGLDTVLGVMEGLFSEWGDDRYRPAPLLRRMVAAGRLGLKSGTGFYNHNLDSSAD